MVVCLTFAPIATAHPTAHAVHFGTRVPRHISSVRYKSKTRQDIVLMAFLFPCCENIFVGCSVTSTFFLILSITLKNKKILYVGSFNFFSFTIPMGSNWYMNTGVRDLEVESFKVNSTRFNDM